MSADLVIGLFVGGSGRRMGGVAKGLLRSPSGETLIGRLHRVVRDALPAGAVVLVGDAEAYSPLGVPAVPDAPGGVGPIGGLRGLLLHANAKEARAVLAFSCDLPWIEAPLIERLAREAPEASLLAPRENGLWSALTARYALSTLEDVERAIQGGRHSLQQLFAAAGERAATLALDAAERGQLIDWDCPEDVERR